MDTMLRPGTNYCLCRPCGVYFRTLQAFGRHLTGPIGDRRHLSEAEMRGAGLERDAWGYWRLPPRAGPAHLREPIDGETLPRTGEGL